MKNIHTTVTVIFILVIVWSTSIHSSESENKLDLRIVPVDEVNDVFSNSEVIVVDEVKDNMFVNQYYKDGLVTSNRQQKKLVGIWFIDQDGKHCIRWNHKDTSNCGIIMQDDEGNWVKVKEDRIVKRYENIESLPSLGSQ